MQNRLSFRNSLLYRVQFIGKLVTVHGIVLWCVPNISSICYNQEYVYARNFQCNTVQTRHMHGYIQALWYS